MNIDLVRFIDKFVGIPICYVLSLHNNLLKFFKNFTNKKVVSDKAKMKDILLIELSEMGSTIIAYSAMKRLKQAYPEVNLHFLIFKKNMESVELLGIIPPSNIYVIRDDSFVHFLLDTLKYIVLALKMKFDAVIDLELFSRFTAILAYLSGSPRRVGYFKYAHEGLYRGNLLTHNVYYNPHVHMVYNFHALVESLIKNEYYQFRAPVNSFPIYLPEIKFDPSILKRFQALIPTNHPLIILNPNPGKLLPIRNWGKENFAKICREAIKHLRATIVLVGLPNAQEDADFIKEFNGNSSKIIDLTGKTASIYELIHVFSLADVLITNDSGPAHFASLTAITNIVFFGPETPALYKPVSEKTIAVYEPFSCSPCLTAMNHRKTVCKENLCLKAVSVEAVYKIIESALQKVDK